MERGLGANTDPAEHQDSACLIYERHLFASDFWAPSLRTHMDKVGQGGQGGRGRWSMDYRRSWLYQEIEAGLRFDRKVM